MNASGASLGPSILGWDLVHFFQLTLLPAPPAGLLAIPSPIQSRCKSPDPGTPRMVQLLRPLKPGAHALSPPSFSFIDFRVQWTAGEWEAWYPQPLGQVRS